MKNKDKNKKPKEKPEIKKLVDRSKNRIEEEDIDPIEYRKRFKGEEYEAD